MDAISLSRERGSRAAEQGEGPRCTVRAGRPVLKPQSS